MYDIYLSYAKENREEFALPLKLALSSLGLSIWYDQEQLVIGDHVNKKIQSSINASRFGICLLSRHYFRQGKEISTLLELNLLCQKQLELGTQHRYIIPILCEHISHETLAKAAPIVSQFAYLEWHHGFDKILTQILQLADIEQQGTKASRLEHSISSLKPNTQDKAAALIQICHDSSFFMEAAHIALEFMKDHPSDPNILKLYLSSIEKTGNKFEIIKATAFVYSWLKQRQQDKTVLDRLMTFVLKNNRNAIPTLLEDLGIWLIENHNPNIRAAYLSIVAERGTSIQVEQAISASERWVIKDKSNQVRVNRFLLISEKGSTSEQSALLDETRRWLLENPGDKIVRPVFINAVCAQNDPELKRQTIESQFEWLTRNPTDSFVLPTFLNLVSKYRDRKLIDAAIAHTNMYLRDPRTVGNTRVDEKFAAFLKTHGTQEQKRLFIEILNHRLNEISTDGKKTSNSRSALIRWIGELGTDEQVSQCIKESIDWLQKFDDDIYMRSDLLDLVRVRCKSINVFTDIFLYYRDWLDRHKDFESATEVRGRFIDYIIAIGTVDQIRTIEHDTDIWLQKARKAAKVRQSLWNLAKRRIQLEREQAPLTKQEP